MPLFSLVSVVTVAQRTADPVAPPPAPADAEWRWLGMQGFPDSYRLSGSVKDQIEGIGNSVCPPVAEALVRANMGGA